MLKTEEVKHDSVKITYHDERNVNSIGPLFKEAVDHINLCVKNGNQPPHVTTYLYIIDGYTYQTFNAIQKHLTNIKDDSKTVIINNQRLSGELVPFIKLPIDGLVSLSFFKENYVSLLQAIEHGVFIEPSFHQNISLEISKQRDRKTPIKNLTLVRDKVVKRLSEKESHVLQLIMEGHTNSQIAKKLFFAPSTVSTYISNILRKLNANHRTDAVVRAIKEGWVDAKR